MSEKEPPDTEQNKPQDSTKSDESSTEIGSGDQPIELSAEDLEKIAESLGDDELEGAGLDADSDSDSEDVPTPSLKALITSEDTPSRFMTLLSLGFGVLALLCMSLLVSMYLKYRKAHEVKVVPPPVVSVEVVNESLGEFKTFIKSRDPNIEERELRVEIVAQCNTVEACHTLKEKLPEARDVVLPILSAATQEDFFSADAKNTIRERVTDRLNTIKMEGKVENVHFTSLTVEKGK